MVIIGEILLERRTQLSTFEKALVRFNESVEHSAICVGLLTGDPE